MKLKRYFPTILKGGIMEDTTILEESEFGTIVKYTKELQEAWDDYCDKIVVKQVTDDGQTKYLCKRCGQEVDINMGENCEYCGEKLKW